MIVSCRGAIAAAKAKGSVICRSVITEHRLKGPGFMASARDCRQSCLLTVERLNAMLNNTEGACSSRSHCMAESPARQARRRLYRPIEGGRKSTLSHCR